MRKGGSDEQREHPVRVVLVGLAKLLNRPVELLCDYLRFQEKRRSNDQSDEAVKQDDREAAECV